jgi:hypothetical protein
MTGAGYEHSDVSVGSVLWFALSLAITLFVVSVVTHELLLRLYGVRSLAEVLAQQAPAPERTVPGIVRPIPLQGTPRYAVYGPAEIDAIRRQENLFLSTYGCVDSRRGIARIPIREAMKRLVEHGLPAKESRR